MQHQNVVKYVYKMLGVPLGDFHSARLFLRSGFLQYVQTRDQNTGVCPPKTVILNNFK